MTAAASARAAAARGGTAERGTVVAADVATVDPPGRPRAPALVFLHGQPGSGADWQQVIRLLPAHWHTVAADRPGYGSNPRPAAGFAANARDVFAQMDSRGIQRAVLVGHSYGGGVALAAASVAPHRVEAVVLLASVGPGCVDMWDRLLAAPGTGPLCALVAWRLTPWVARARLARLTRRQARPLAPGEHVNWQIWAHASRDRGRLWRSFLAEQRALVHELSQVVAAIPLVQAPVLLLTDPGDRLVPLGTARQLAKTLPGARLQLVEGTGHQLPIRAPDVVADALVAFLDSQAELGARGMRGAGELPRGKAASSRLELSRPPPPTAASTQRTCHRRWSLNTTSGHRDPTEAIPGRRGGEHLSDPGVDDVLAGGLTFGVSSTRRVRRRRRPRPGPILSPSRR